MQNSVTTHEIKDGVITTKTVFSINGKEEVLISTSPVKKEPYKPFILTINPDALKRLSIGLKHGDRHRAVVKQHRLVSVSEDSLSESEQNKKKRHHKEDAELSKSGSLTSNITIYPADGNGEVIHTNVAWNDDN